uniref:T9SS type A sorting domain-containing protein n=1 Tax=candidate division WOR-3 bacterium TaxID=2052148 RepID=A0A7V3KPD1_UNCW3
MQIYIRGKELIVKTNKPAENLTLIVHDVMGREIERVEINGKFEKRTYLNLSKGVYFYRLLQDNRTVTKGKIVLVD